MAPQTPEGRFRELCYRKQVLAIIPGNGMPPSRSLQTGGTQTTAHCWQPASRGDLTWAAAPTGTATNCRGRQGGHSPGAAMADGLEPRMGRRALRAEVLRQGMCSPPRTVAAWPGSLYKGRP